MTKFFKLTLILVFSFTIYSCSTDPVALGAGAGKPSDNDTKNDPTTDEDLQKLPFTVSPSDFIFPKTQTNSVSSSSMMIRNTSKNDLILLYRDVPTELTVVNSADQGSCNAYSKQRRLKPNESCFIEFAFQPKKDDSYEDIIPISYSVDDGKAFSTVKLRYNARSVSALGDEIVQITPSYLTFYKNTGTPLFSRLNATFVVVNQTKEDMEISAKQSEINQVFSVEDSSTCLKGLKANSNCSYNILFDKKGALNNNANYEGNITISATGKHSRKGLTQNKPMYALVRHSTSQILNSYEHRFQNVTSNYKDFDVTTVRINAKESISRVSYNFIKSSIVQFNNAAFLVDTVNCNKGVFADSSCDLVIKFQPIFPIYYEALLNIVLSTTTGEKVESMLLSGFGVESKDNATSIEGLVVSNDTVSIITEAGLKKSEKLILTNKGERDLVISINYMLKDVYSISGCTGTILSSGNSCIVTIDFDPKEINRFEDRLKITAGGTASEVYVKLNGIATAPNVALGSFTFNPSRMLDFGKINAGSSSASKTVVVTANIDADFFEYNITDSAAFNIVSSTCNGKLKNSSQCSISISFTPNATKKYSAILRVFRKDKVDSIELLGEGLEPTIKPTINGLYISSPAIVFTNTLVGSTTSSKTIMLKNNNTSSLALVYSDTIVGKAKVFDVISDCTAVLKPAEECSITVKFMPIDAINYEDKIYINSGASTDTITLTGVGVDKSVNYNPETLIKNLEVSRKRIDFIKTEVSTKSVTEEIVLKYKTSSGKKLDYTIENKMPHIFQIDANLTTCNLSFTGAEAAGEECKFVYSFNPSDGEYYEDIITIKDRAVNGETVEIKLTGTGIAYISSRNFGVVSPGFDAKVQTILFVNDTNFAYSLGKVTVTDIARDGNKVEKGRNAGFKLVSTACENVKLLPGKSCQSTVSFKPTIDDVNGVGYQGKLTIQEAGGEKYLQLLGASRHNTLLKLDYWFTGSAFVGWGTKVVSINNKIYSIGNENIADHKKLREYNTATNRWSVITPLGTAPFDDNAKIFPIGRPDGEAKRSTSDYKFTSHVGIVSNADKFYVFGGWFDPKQSGYTGGFSSNMLAFYNQADTRFNPQGTWTRLNSLPESLFATPGRHGQSIGLINNKIYAFSGRDIGSKAMDDFLLYDIAGGEWKNMAPKITGTKPRAAAFTAVIGFDGKLYVDGGYQETTMYNEFWIFDPSNTAAGEFGTWTQITKNTPTQTRFMHSMVNIGGMIYVGGGQTANKIFVFNTKDKADNDYGSWKSPLAPLGYTSNKTVRGDDKQDSVMVNVDDHIWINHYDEMWVYYP